MWASLDRDREMDSGSKKKHVIWIGNGKAIKEHMEDIFQRTLPYMVCLPHYEIKNMSYVLKIHFASGRIKLGII